eukprot:TRINITY_DN801_c1_g1_i23.p1 TRINITY_DN801_c1_g1~~TRINITY_DN801_c1_g1_i23.p1  ORF type:complete len:225 (-),score=47.76 TRINITY_DN801_c1_g1_i23:560-1234(-)
MVGWKKKQWYQRRVRESRCLDNGFSGSFCIGLSINLYSYSMNSFLDEFGEWIEEESEAHSELTLLQVMSPDWAFMENDQVCWFPVEKPTILVCGAHEGLLQLLILLLLSCWMICGGGILSPLSPRSVLRLVCVPAGTVNKSGGISEQSFLMYAFFSQKIHSQNSLFMSEMEKMEMGRNQLLQHYDQQKNHVEHINMVLLKDLKGGGNTSFPRCHFPFTQNFHKI